MHLSNEVMMSAVFSARQHIWWCRCYRLSVCQSVLPAWLTELRTPLSNFVMHHRSNSRERLINAVVTVCLSVHPSVRRTGGSVKKVEVRTVQFSSYSNYPFCVGKLHPEILTGYPW